MNDSLVSLSDVIEVVLKAERSGLTDAQINAIVLKIKLLKKRSGQTI